MSNIFIAPKIKVGFQKRSDTFTGQLAYIIYYDEKGKLRKEKSWETWRDKTIDPQEFDNAPMDGFTLNKDIKRYSGGWFSSNRTMIRVHDPRGFEFEVTTENLIGILMHTDCLRRGLIGQFVYAWAGTELVLLPTNSEEYQNATKYTSGLAKNVSTKSLVPGVSYRTKREGDVIYMGRLNWYEYKGALYCNKLGVRREEKVHVFTNDDGKSFFKKSPSNFLSEPNSDQPVSNYAELMDKFNSKNYANKIVKYDFRPVIFNESTVEQQYYGPKLARSNYFHETVVNGTKIFSEAQASVVTKRNTVDGGRNDTFSIEGYDIHFEDWYGHNSVGMNPINGEMVEVVHSRSNGNRSYYSYSHNQTTKYDLEYMKKLPLFDLYVIYENGKEKRFTSIYQFTSNQEVSDNDDD